MVNDKFCCFGMEPTKLRIPEGVYGTRFTTSSKFSGPDMYNHDMIEVVGDDGETLGVDGRDQVYFHRGTRYGHSRGCILLADTIAAFPNTGDKEPSQWDCTPAYQRFYTVVSYAMKHEDPVKFIVSSWPKGIPVIGSTSEPVTVG